MTFTDEEILVASLSSKLEDPIAVREECTQFVERYETIAKKANWAYQHFLRQTGSRSTFLNYFQTDFLQAWCDFFKYAAMANLNQKIEIPITDYRQKLILTWHFPEYPLLVPEVCTNNILLVAAQKTNWMVSAAGLENLYLFRSGSTGISLIRAFKEQRPIAAMLDYCYDESSHITANFLSYPARTPIGLFTLAEKFNYQIELLSFRDAECVVIDSFWANQGTILDNVIRVNQVIEKEILTDPARWLLWPSVDRRWIGTDYES